MKLHSFALAITVSLLAGCSPDSKKAEPPAAAAMKHVAPKPLLPLYEEVSNCIAECISVWYRVPKDSQYPQANFEPKLPLSFAELMILPEETTRFASLVEQLPPRIQPVGKLGPDDEERTEHSVFGSYEHEKPKLHGVLDNVIAINRRLIYIYSGVNYFRIRDSVKGSLHVAIDPMANEYAGVFRGGADLDEYYIVGAQSLRPALLAYTVAKDLETADMLAHYARKEPGPYEFQPVVLSLNKSRDEALERVALLNERLGALDGATNVPPPQYLLQAKATQSARAWYGVSQDRDRCVASPMSPADRIDVIKSSGITPRVTEILSEGALSAVEVTVDDGRYETTWRFFKSKSDCELTIVSSPTPEKYR